MLINKLGRFRQKLPEGSWVRHLADTVAAFRRPPLSPFLIPRVLALFSEHFPNAKFVQIGSNDGVKHDPLRRYILTRRWQGLQVEPVPEIYARLQRNTRHLSRVRAVHAAIGLKNGSSPFYRLRAPDIGEVVVNWYDGIGSFRREVLQKHASSITRLEERIECIQVTSLTFDTLCERNNLSHIDLIHIDAEGYDFEIIKQIRLSHYRPSLVLYEHHHLGAEQSTCRDYMKSQGFSVHSEGLDTLCVNTNSKRPQDQRFLQRWGELVVAWEQINSK